MASDQPQAPPGLRASPPHHRPRSLPAHRGSPPASRCLTARLESCNPIPKTQDSRQSPTNQARLSIIGSTVTQSCPIPRPRGTAGRAAQTCTRNCPSSSSELKTPSLARSPAGLGRTSDGACSSTGSQRFRRLEKAPEQLLDLSAPVPRLAVGVADLGQPPASRPRRHGLRGHPEQERHLAARHQILTCMVTGHGSKVPCEAQMLIA